MSGRTQTLTDGEDDGSAVGSGVTAVPVEPSPVAPFGEVVAAPLVELEEALGRGVMGKEEAMGVASELLRDPEVPANQKGPILSAMARVAGWETAPEYDFEKERVKMMVNFERMVKSGVSVDAGLRAVLEKYPGAKVELREVIS